MKKQNTKDQKFEDKIVIFDTETTEDVKNENNLNDTTLHLPCI